MGNKIIRNRDTEKTPKEVNKDVSDLNTTIRSIGECKMELDTLIDKGVNYNNESTKFNKPK